LRKEHFNLTKAPEVGRQAELQANRLEKKIALEEL
jgi:hypothetical protein